MDLNIKETEIENCYLIQKKPFHDLRGIFFKQYETQALQKYQISFAISEAFYTLSNKNVLRGLHFQTPPHDHAKLISCLSGHILDVIVDLRAQSKSFRRAIGIELRGMDGQSIYVPKGCAHGFYSYQDQSLVAYLVETSHSPANDAGILWSSIDFKWPATNPLLSKRDSELPNLLDFQTPFQIRT